MLGIRIQLVRTDPYIPCILHIKSSGDSRSRLAASIVFEFNLVLFTCAYYIRFDSCVHWCRRTPRQAGKECCDYSVPPLLTTIGWFTDIHAGVHLPYRYALTMHCSRNCNEEACAKENAVSGSMDTRCSVSKQIVNWSLRSETTMMHLTIYLKLVIAKLPWHHRGTP